MTAMPVSPSLSTQEYIAMEEQFGAHNYHPLDIVIDLEPRALPPPHPANPA
jgi:ornithine--oxo-acid transaminase